MFNSPYGNYSTLPYQNQQPQNRMSQIEQQYGVGYPQGYQMQSMQQMNVQMLKGRPVSSYDEAKASMIDLDGSLFVFTDIANKKIYTKQILLDGSAELKTYSLVEEKNKTNETITNDSNDYVLKKDFNRIMKQINKKIDSLSLGGLEDESNKHDDEPNAKK